jgi:hypothetical protein
MASAFRVEDGDSTFADRFEQLQDPVLFKAFCQILRDEKEL